MMKKQCASLILVLIYAINAYGQCAPDITPPTITCPGNVISACPQEVPSLTPTTSDFCGVVLQTYTLTGATTINSDLIGINDASSELFLAGVTTVTYYIEDVAGNSATCNFTVTVNDFTSPIVVCQDDITAINDSGLCTAYVDMFALDVFPTAFDSCSGLSTVPTGVPPGSNFPVGTTTVTWIVTDAAGNFETCLQDVTVTDEEDPTVICPSDITVNAIPGQCDAIVTIPPALPSDNCTISSIINDYNSGGANASGTYPLGTTTVTYTATDSANRTITCSFDVTVLNTQIPVITLIGANIITIEACSSYTELGATAVDNCLGDISSSIIIDASALDTDVVGSYSVTYNVTNANGTSATQVIRTVIVVDTTPPTLSLIGPDPLTIADCSTYTELGAVAIDPCFGDISASIVINSSIDTSSLGSYTVTYNVIDASGNVAAQITRTVIVADVTIPLITLIGSDPQTIEACSAYVELGATVNDFCFGDISGSIVIDASAVNTNVIGSYAVTYNVTDANGNSAIEVIRTVDVVDTTIPTITLIGVNPQTVEACTPYSELGATANDPCFGDISGSIIIDATAVNTSVIGTYSVTYNVTDANGNNAVEVIRTVNVIDSTNPTITCPSDIAVNNDATLCSAVVNYIAPVGTDACSSVTTTQIAGLPSGSDFPVGTTINTFEVEDASGNISTCSFNITVNDTEVPTISCPADITLGNDTGMCSAVVNYSTPVGADNCPGQITIQTAGLPSGSTFPIGTTTNTFQVTDAENNMTTCSFDVIITDSQAPIISCPSDIVVSNDVGLCSAIVSYTVPVGADNCFGQITIQTAGLPPGSIFPVGTTTNTFQVTDTANNTATCSFDVIVNDTESPIAICQDISIQLDPITGSVTIIPADIDNGSTDNCGVILSLSVTTFNCNDIGNNTVTLTVSDATGNSSTCDAIVTVTDLSENASVNIVSTATTTCQNEAITFTATPTNGGASPSYQWQINGVDVAGETASNFTSSTLVDADEVTVLMTSSFSICAQAQVSNTITISVNDNNLPADAGSDYINFICTNTTVTLAGNAITGSGTTGLWTVTSGQTTGFSFSDVTSATSTFTGDIGETYTLMWSIDNPPPCIDTNDSLTITFIGCNALDFDGVDDNITFRDNYNLNATFTIEVWMKAEVTNGNIQTIISKRETDNQIDGYDIRLVNNVVSFHWNNGQSLSASPIQITQNKWHHIAVTYGSSTYKLYIDGIEVNSVVSGAAPITNTVDCIVGAMEQTLNAPFLPLHYFDGGIDELRIWDIALTATQIRKMMNQEIEDNSSNVRGVVVPIDVPGLTWNNLSGYYQMNQISDISSGNLTANSTSAIPGVLRFMTTFQPESAPIPYQSITNGTWSNSNTWLNGITQFIPNSIGVDGSTPVTWNIVRSSHNVSSGNKNIIVLGLVVNNNKLTIENTDPTDGQSLRITDYLIIDGADTVLKLVGESQLLQDSGSIVDYSGTGKLHRDQQGTANLYNYNYWSSPVSTDGSTFPIGDVLYDGTQPVLWTTAHDANPSTSPITMSSRWLYLYENYPVNSYADWNRINQNFAVQVGLGFLMKGSGVVGPSQNYTFVGKVNNGNITTPIIADYEALVGNPYPSAIDSHEFINDNSSSILGTIYYWEHYTTNDTHILRDYQGGFAAYNLTGGNPAVSPPEVSGLGTPSKIPERYIPVSQGFNVFANATGGTVLFENDQRIFVKESVTGAADNGSVFMRQHNSEQRNPHLPPEPDLVKRIRIDFKTPEEAIRPLLLGFVSDDLASDDFNYGYDAINKEALPNDMSWMIADEKYIIQGVGDFEITKQYPIGIFLTQSGNIEISLKALENFDSEIDVFVYDTLLGTYTRFNDISYQINLDAGDYLNRFFITFMQDGTLSTIDQELQQIVVNYLTDTNEIYINVPMSINVKQVYLVNMLGQTIKSWNMTNSTLSNEMKIPVKHISEGNYIIKVLTTTGEINKKVIVKY